LKGALLYLVKLLTLYVLLTPNFMSFSPLTSASFVNAAKGSCWAIGCLAVVGAFTNCHRLPSPPAAANPQDCVSLLSRAKMLQELRQKRIYARYARSSLWLQPSLTKHCEGLYFVVLPSRTTHYNVWIPCLVTREKTLLNTSMFMGAADADTLGSAAILDAQLQRLSATFSRLERDSMKQVFAYGGQVNLKAGHYVRYR
jgi:hypothetical protein